MQYEDRLRKADFCVDDAPLAAVRAFVAEHHYARGGSNTATFAHGLYSLAGDLCGVAWWIPPTKHAARTVDDDWTRVLALTRMAVAPNVPKNACSFMLARSVRVIFADGRFRTLLAYADTGRGHEGGVYRAAGWTHVGLCKPSDTWVDAEGRQASRKAGPRTYTKAEMEARGYRRLLTAKRKYVLKNGK